MFEEFKINKSFAKKYCEDRRKEELKRLKKKCTGIEVKKDKKLDQLNESSSDEEELNAESDASSSASDSSDQSAIREQDNLDFLNLLDALENKAPELDDPNKFWFHDHAKSGDESLSSSSETQSKKKKKHVPVRLKDHERQAILEVGRLEDEELIERGKQVAEMDSDVLLEKLDKSAVADFHKQVEAEETKTKKAKKKTKVQKPEIDLSKFEKSSKKWQLSASGNLDDEEFLKSYFINKKWLKSHPTGEVSVAPTDKRANTLTGPEITKSDDVKELFQSNPEDIGDEWLVRKNASEEVRDASEESEQEEEEGDKPVYGEQMDDENDEDDDDGDAHFNLKTYPRKIAGTVRQPQGKTRAEKRKEHKQRKEERRREKLAYLAKFNELQREEYESKIAKIKKSSGLQDDLADLDLVKMLDEEDWDPEAHERLMNKMFNQDYFEQADQTEADPGDPAAADDAGENPPFIEQLRQDDDEEANSEIDYDQLDVEQIHRSGRYEEEEEEEDPIQSSKLSKRKRARLAKKNSRLIKVLKKEKPKYDPDQFPDFDDYFDKYYKLDYEDLINGQKPGEDIICKFQYRKVKPNDFGLTAEEILMADDAELNKWVSVKRMSQYRDEEEEERDLTHFKAEKRQNKKKHVLHSIYAVEEEQELEAEEAPPPVKKLKKNKQVDSVAGSNSTVRSVPEERLLAAGLTAKEIKKLKYSQQNGC